MPKVSIVVNGVTAYCTVAQVRDVSRQLQESCSSDRDTTTSCARSVGVDSQSRFAVAADAIVRFSEDTHAVIADAATGPVADLRSGVSLLRRQVFRGYFGQERKDALKVLKSLDSLHSAHCEIKHYSHGKLKSLASETGVLIGRLLSPAAAPSDNISTSVGSSDENCFAEPTRAEEEGLGSEKVDDTGDLADFEAPDGDFGLSALPTQHFQAPALPSKVGGVVKDALSSSDGAPLSPCRFRIFSDTSTGFVTHATDFVSPA